MNSEHSESIIDVIFSRIGHSDWNDVTRESRTFPGMFMDLLKIFCLLSSTFSHSHSCSIMNRASVFDSIYIAQHLFTFQFIYVSIKRIGSYLFVYSGYGSPYFPAFD